MHGDSSEICITEFLIITSMSPDDWPYTKASTNCAYTDFELFLIHFIINSSSPIFLLACALGSLLSG